jgi:hypothetical protein
LRVDQVLDDLEAELHARFDDATLTAYADHLQSLGDPRGELIALDLAGVAPDDPRRGELLAAWLGPSVPLRCGDGVWCAGDPENTWATFDRGFVEIVATGGLTDALAELLASPAGTFLHRLCIAGDGRVLRPALSLVAQRPRVWLRDLAISDELTDPILRGDEPLVGRGLHDVLVESTPRLERIDVVGRRVFRALAHPGIREISIVGSDAIGLPDGPALPNVTTLDVAFSPDEVPPEGTLERLLAPGRFPNLRQLRLWREEPGARALYPLLHEIAIAPSLTHLKLPSIRSRSDLGVVQRAIDAIPGLHVVDIARAYNRHGGVERHLRHTSARIRLPLVSAWPPPDMVQPDDLIEINARRVSLESLIELMEEQYAAMPELARDAWDRVWYAAANLGIGRMRPTPGGVEELPAATLHTAFDAVDAHDFPIHALRDELARLVEAGSYRSVAVRLR